MEQIQKSGNELLRMVMAGKLSGAQAAARLRIIARAVEKLDTPYPEENPPGSGRYPRTSGTMDCSELAAEAYRSDLDGTENGKQTARYQWKFIAGENDDGTVSGWLFAKTSDISGLTPGDAIFWSSSNKRQDMFHVAIYIGDGSMIDATLTKDINGVSIRSVNSTIYDHNGNPVNPFGHASPPRG